MSLALVYSRALSGMNAPLVEVEAHLANGLPHFNIVGAEYEIRFQAAGVLRCNLATAKEARYVLPIIRRPFSDGIFPYTIAD